jgi:hypothetical protein
MFERLDIEAVKAGGFAGKGTRPTMDTELNARLDRIEGMLTALVARQTIKDFYSTDEFAQIVGKAEFTVREWCRLGRIRAEKRRSGRGAHTAWVVSHQELIRYEREGLLPIARGNTALS